jgi:hypothetical protein
MRKKRSTTELHNFRFSPSATTLVDERKVRWSEHVERTGEMRIQPTILVSKWRHVCTRDTLAPVGE